ncbi:MAG: proline/glycine betaine ABC transporter substrate-binding protein ProX [Arcobacter sp.]|nr:MAG: proline/glycine betaine ABC transporter substrate-binding protein ProX [Arcobacter sp.]
MKKILLLTLGLVLSSSLYAKVKVYPLQSPVLEEKFQTIIVNRALEKLGYEVEPIQEVAYEVAFQTIGQNAKSKDVYFMADNWDPTQVNMYNSAGGDKKLYRKGVYVPNCAVGYLVDKETADKYNIKYISDLKDPKLAKLFDIDGDGKADLTGASPGWEVVEQINHHIKAYGLKNTIDHKQGEYSAMIANTIARYKSGKPILYWSWTPYWVSGKLVPGKDVVWLQVPFSDNKSGKDTKLANGANFGFEIQTQRIVANKSVEKNYPDIAKLFSIMKLNPNDLSAQSTLLSKGENKDKDINRHVDMWLKANKALFNSWVNEAKKLQ